MPSDVFSVLNLDIYRLPASSDFLLYLMVSFSAAVRW